MPRTRAIRLRDITSADLLTLWRWRTDPWFIATCASQRTIPDQAMFRREFEHEKRTGVKHVQYLIERCRDGVPVGWVFTHGHRPIDRYAFL